MHKLDLDRIRHKFAENSIRYRLPLLLNKTPTIILEKTVSHSEFGFKTYIKNSMLSKYQDVCTIPECYICGN